MPSPLVACDVRVRWPWSPVLAASLSFCGLSAVADPSSAQSNAHGAGAEQSPKHSSSYSREYSVEIGACEGLVRDQVEHFLALEFGATELRASSTTPEVRVRVGCEVEQVRIEAVFADGARATRDLYLYEVQGKVGARLLALAIAELVRRAPAAPVIAEPSTAPKDDGAKRGAVPESDPRFSVNAKAELMVFAGDGLPLWGAGLGVAWFSQAPVVLSLDLSLVSGTEQFDFGEVTVAVVSATPQVGLGKRWAEGSLGGTIGYRIGAARIAGHAASGAAGAAGSVAGSLMGPLLAVHSSATLHDPIELMLSAEAGHVTAPLVGEVEGERGLRLDGLWWRVALGLGIVL